MYKIFAFLSAKPLSNVSHTSCPLIINMSNTCHVIQHMSFFIIKGIPNYEYPKLCKQEIFLRGL